MAHTIEEITKAMSDGIAAGKLDTTPGNVFRSAWPAAKDHGYHGTLHDVFTAGYLSEMPAEGVTVYSTGVVVEQPTGHPYKASTTSPLCEVCGERKINRYGTHGLPGLEQGDRQDCETPAGMERARAAAQAMVAEMEQPAPAEKPIVYLSCQYCHKPAGDQHTKENGYCYYCKAEMVAAGHAREGRITTAAQLLREDAKRVGFLSVNNTTRTGPDGCLPALS